MYLHRRCAGLGRQVWWPAHDLHQNLIAGGMEPAPSSKGSALDGSQAHPGTMHGGLLAEWRAESIQQPLITLKLSLAGTSACHQPHCCPQGMVASNHLLT